MILQALLVSKDDATAEALIRVLSQFGVAVDRSSDGDIALLPKASHDTARYVSGEYRFEIMPGVSHWIPDEQPDKLADLLLDWFAAHQAD